MNITIEGHRAAVLKSALQKYLRRDMPEKGLACLRLLTGCPSRAIITNVLNRLVVMMTEEVNIHNARLPALFHGLYRERQAEVMYRMLLTSRKCRLVSDYQCWYSPPSELIRTPRPPVAWCLDAADPFVGALDADPDDVWQDLRERVIRDGPDPLRDSVLALYDFWMLLRQQAERPAYLIHALLLWKHRADVDWDEVPTPSTARPAEDAPLVLDDFVRGDMHLRPRRKRTPADHARFATEGALVPNEDRRFLRPDLRHRYLMWNGGFLRLPRVHGSFYIDVDRVYRGPYVRDSDALELNLTIPDRARIDSGPVRFYRWTDVIEFADGSCYLVGPNVVGSAVRRVDGDHRRAVVQALRVCTDLGIHNMLLSDDGTTVWILIEDCQGPNQPGSDDPDILAFV